MQPADEFACSRALGALAGSLDSESLARALHLARGLRDSGARARSLAVLARALLAADGQALLEEALLSARSIDDPWRRVRALTPVALRLPAEAREPIAREALEDALAVRGDWLRGRALGLLANFAAGEVRARAMQAAGALGSPNERASALCNYADDLSASEVEHLLAQGETIDDDWQLHALLTSLAGRLTAQGLDRALRIADRIHDAPRALALLALARVNGEKAQVLLVEALTDARALGQPSDRAETLTALLEDLPAEVREAAATEALDAVRQVDDAAVRAMLLADLVPLLPEAGRAEVCAEGVAVARTIEDSVLRAERLSAFVGHLDEHSRVHVIEEVFKGLEGRT
jgi:hypothetical protein